MLLGHLDNSFKLLEQYLGFLHNPQQFYQLEVGKCSLADILKQVESRIEPLIKERNIRLVKRIRVSSSETITLDKMQFCIALFNLLKNGAEASRPGGRLVLSIFRRNSRLCFRVRDFGCGITKEQIEQVLQPGYSKKGSRGRGYGLSISQKIVTLHRGELKIKRLPRGTSFTILLPIGNEEQEQEQKERTQKEPEHKRRVLVVDDDIAIVEAMKMCLENTCNVTIAYDGQEAFRQIEQENFDKIVADISIAGQGGIELFNYLALNYPGMEDKIVFVTGGATEERAERFLKSIDNPVIYKPFNMELLIENV